MIETGHRPECCPAYAQKGRIPYGPCALKRRPINSRYSAKTRVICSWRNPYALYYMLNVAGRRFYFATAPIRPTAKIPFLFMSNSVEKSQPKEVADVPVRRRHTSHCMGYHAKTNLTSHAIPLLQDSMDELKTGVGAPVLTSMRLRRARPKLVTSKWALLEFPSRERSPGSGFWADEQTKAVSRTQIVGFTRPSQISRGIPFPVGYVAVMAAPFERENCILKAVRGWYN